MSPDLGYLADMLESARLALEHTAGLTEEAFSTDVKTQDAVIRRLGRSCTAADRENACAESRVHENLPRLIENLERFLEAQQ